MRTDGFGRVDNIDNAKVFRYTKLQLTNVNLMYYHSICEAVANQQLNKCCIHLVPHTTYHTDTTELSIFVCTDSTIRLTVDRLCVDKSSESYYGE